MLNFLSFFRDPVVLKHLRGTGIVFSAILPSNLRWILLGPEKLFACRAVYTSVISMRPHIMIPTPGITES